MIHSCVSAHYRFRLLPVWQLETSKFILRAGAMTNLKSGEEIETWQASHSLMLLNSANDTPTSIPEDDTQLQPQILL